jgi:hypothetical protein
MFTLYCLYCVITLCIALAFIRSVSFQDSVVFQVDLSNCFLADYSRLFMSMGISLKLEMYPRYFYPVHQ